MSIDRRTFLTALGSSLALPALSAQGDSGAGSKPYGSGSFGEWMEDEHGLPAFRYTCDQVNDKRAVTQVNAGILTSTDHIHQVGNDRLVAIASNYGHLQVRQDEGAPKFLNAYSPERSQFGGGIGWLTDGHEMLSTWYPGNAETFERVFGIGYVRKRVAKAGWAVDQVIFAPFGDDPVLVSQVTITNHGSAAAKLRWIEYWGCQLYQFSFRSAIEGSMAPAAVAKKRFEFGDRFAHRFERMSDSGLMESKQFLGRTPEEEAAWKGATTYLAAHPNPFLAAVQEGAPGSSFDDLHPPATFLVSLDGPADGMSSSAKAFFGAGGPLHPDGLNKPLDGDLSASGRRRRAPRARYYARSRKTGHASFPVRLQTGRRELETRSLRNTGGTPPPRGRFRARSGKRAACGSMRRLSHGPCGRPSGITITSAAASLTTTFSASTSRRRAESINT